jgi:putative FmdB family regulatory protein
MTATSNRLILAIPGKLRDANKLEIDDMPTYDYECQNCDHAFELFQMISEPLKRKCPECGKLKLKRLIGAGAAVVFKGSGFYQTDYRSESYKKSAKAEKKASSESPKGSSNSNNSEKKPKSKDSGTKSTATKDSK